GKALEEREDRYLRLEPRQRRADAKMQPAAEGDMRRLLAGDVEAMRLMKRSRIAIGAAQRENQRLALFDRAASEIHVARRDTARDVDGRFIAQDFFDRGIDQGGIGLERGALIGMREKKPDAVADEIGGGEVAAYQEPLEVVGDLAFAELRPLRLQGHHVADEIVLWVLRALRHHGAHIVGE